MSHITILVWKHFMSRKRRYIQTAIEYLSPILFFFAFIWILKALLPEVRSDHHIDSLVKNTEIINLQEFHRPDVIVYMPDNEITKSLMDEVGRKLNIPRLDKFSGRSRNGYYGVNDEDLIKFIDDMDNDDAIVIFENMEDTVPERLNYTIRMKYNFRTYTYRSMDDDISPHSMYGSNYESFMFLQWAIDSSYLEIRTGTTITQTILFQEFPFFVNNDGKNYLMFVGPLLGALCFLTLWMPFVFLMTRLLAERVSGLQELIKLSGVSLPSIQIAHLLNVMPVGLVYSLVGTLLLKLSPCPVIPETNALYFILILLLHFLSIVAIAFSLSYLTNSLQHAGTLAALSYVTIYIPQSVVANYKMAYWLRMLSGLLPHTPLFWFFSEVFYFEKSGKPLTVSEMVRSHTSKTGSVLECYLLLLLQIAVFTLLCVYLSLLRPGKYGTPRAWNFCFKKRVDPETMSIEELEFVAIRDPQYFEEPPANKEVGIKFVNVTKVFNNNRALSNVSFDVYNGEITVLLGHNGAGKTTLMSIVSGMLQATDGKVYVNGYDTEHQQRDVRKQLGLCTQHNLFFPDLTIIEHVMFFSMLKGKTLEQSQTSGLEILLELGIKEKARWLSGQLSGGMQRRLQLACALAGGADVLVLDEPTSGLDVETRRELWDLLLSLRGNRTVLLTTHFMEEADALGDRVAALHNGVLRCHATPMFLKKNIGTGYRLSLTTIGAPKEDAITAAVMSQLPGASFRDMGPNEVTYNLPAASTQLFPNLFQHLETSRSKLGIDSLGVAMPTLEEVFLRLCSNVDTSFSKEETDSGVQMETTFRRVTGLRLYMQQMLELTKRHFRHIVFTKWSYLILQVILPIFTIFLFTYMVNNLEQESYKPNRDKLAMNLDVYKDMPVKRVYFKMDEPTVLRTLSDHYHDVDFQESSDVADAVLRTSMTSLEDYSNYLAGIEMNETTVKVLYTTVVQHAAPVALNVLSNLFAKMMLEWSDAYTITTYNHPMERAFDLNHQARKEPKGTLEIYTWAIFVVICVLPAVAHSVSLSSAERAAGTRHILVMSGCAPALYWAARLLFHAALYALVLAAPVVLSAHAFETRHTLDQPDACWTLFFVLILGTLAWLSMTYLISFALKDRTAYLILTAMVIVFGVVVPTTNEVLDSTDGSRKVWGWLLEVSHYVMPPHALFAAMIRTAGVARLNAYCDLNRHLCPALIPIDINFDASKCCEGKKPMCYFCSDSQSPTSNMIVLAVQTLVYMLLVILVEHGTLSVWWARVTTYRPATPVYNDPTARGEKTYVDKAIDMPTKQIPDMLLVSDLHKRYRNLFRSCVSVKGVSFSVKKGECFGVLGVNGAGKSTTFKTIVGEVQPTRGRLFANSFHSKQRGPYLRSLGYCPQFSGLDKFLTGAQNLRLVLTMRGLTSRDIENEIDTWIQVVGLEKHKHMAVSGYSGGCARRLATAAALASGAPLTLLDEPTSGVDVTARRRVWKALQRGLRNDRAVVITSHSMDEMEALCDRIALMSRGEVCALGSPAQLRAAHAAGHAVVLKLHAPHASHASHAPHADETDAPVPINRLKGQMLSKFNCTLKDEHKTMLRYHINETMPYSELFEQLEALKASYAEFIEDYSVTETTLEEVFLSFAQDAADTTPFKGNV